MNNIKLTDLTKKIQNLEYGISGEIEEIAAKLLASKNKIDPSFYLFPLNIGNPLELGQPSISFVREVISATLYPELLKSKDISEDAKKRCSYYLSFFTFVHQIGAYSDNQGYDFVRKSVISYIESRDGQANCTIDDICLTEGGSLAIDYACKMFLENQNDCILLPRPEFPAYSALAKLAGGTPLFYNLQEERKWQVDISELEKIINDAKDQGKQVKIMVVINPGNPTGQVLSLESMQNLVKFCIEKRIVLFADEVYQNNVYGSGMWVSFNKAITLLGTHYIKNLKSICLNSASKGWLGECGMRGGYIVLRNFSEEIKTKILTLTALYGINSVGQLFVELMCNPPMEGRESAETVAKFKAETSIIATSLDVRRKLLIETLNSMKNIKCTDIQGAFYGFPCITMTKAAIGKAKEMGIEADMLYCQECLNETGIMTVPGSKFGQKEGTYHFRITNLIYDIEKFDIVMKKLKEFNDSFFEKYAD